MPRLVSIYETFFDLGVGGMDECYSRGVKRCRDGAFFVLRI
jgi:hypothetical protein